MGLLVGCGEELVVEKWFVVDQATHYGQGSRARGVYGRGTSCGQETPCTQCVLRALPLWIGATPMAIENVDSPCGGRGHPHQAHDC